MERVKGEHQQKGQCQEHLPVQKGKDVDESCKLLAPTVDPTCYYKENKVSGDCISSTNIQKSTPK